MIMNIEKTISEHAVSDILTPMLESQDRIVTEDVAPLFEQATGLGTPQASGTVTTTIEESRSVISAIIRKAWTATLTMLGGASVIGYIAAAYTYLRNRLQGNETYGIPDRRSEISASSPLAANLALLNDRKIGGVIGAPDGVSMGRLLSDPSMLAEITEIIDDNFGWKMRRQFPKFFTSLKKLTLGCDTMYSVGSQVPVITSLNEMEELDLPYMQYDDLALPDGTSRVERNTITNCAKLKTIYADALLYRKNCNMHQMAFVQYCSALTHFYARRFEGFDNCDYRDALISHCDNLEYVYITAPTLKNDAGNNAGTFGGCPKLIHLEVGCYRLVDKSLNIKFWNPTTALDSSLTDLIEEGSTAQNNLQQFLSNFRSFIAERLADNGSGKTLTLSQAVFSEIWDSQGQPQVKGDGLDQLRADIHRIIRTDKQWAVNKA